MPTSKKKFETIDEYIKTFPKSVQIILENLRRTIRQAAPGAEEMISYNIPGFKLGGRGLCSFAGWKNHVSLYPIPHSGTEDFKKEISPYIAGKGTIKFPIGEPVPYPLVKEFVKFAIQDQERRRRY